MNPTEHRITSYNVCYTKLLRIANGEFRKVDAGNVAEYLFATYMMFLIKLYSEKDKYTTEKLVDDAVDLLMHGLLLK